MIWNCPVCGKAFDVLWPHQWAYKIGAQFACSWKCIRANEKQSKGVQEMNTKTKIPVEAKNAAIQAALDGKDPYEPLAPYTSNPKSMWTYIKSVVKKKDPDLYARLPDLRDRKKIETPEGTLAEAMEGMKDAADEFFGKCEEMGLSLGKDEAPEEPKITKPVVFDNMTIREVEGGFGRYRRSDVHGSIYLDFEQTDGADVISLTVKQWRSLREELNRAAAILGVEL